MSKLVVLTQRGIKISEYPVSGTRLTIGRAPSNDIQINNPGVSARHARLVVEDQGCIIEDLDSRNGTYVNLDRIKRHNLRDGDLINFPNCKLKFVADDHDADETYHDFRSWWVKRKTANQRTG